MKGGKSKGQGGGKGGFNPYRDANGRFTSGPGGGGAKKSSSGAKKSAKTAATGGTPRQKLARYNKQFNKYNPKPLTNSQNAVHDGSLARKIAGSTARKSIEPTQKRSQVAKAKQQAAAKAATARNKRKAAGYKAAATRKRNAAAKAAAPKAATAAKKKYTSPALTSGEPKALKAKRSLAAKAANKRKALGIPKPEKAAKAKAPAGKKPDGKAKAPRQSPAAKPSAKVAKLQSEAAKKGEEFAPVGGGARAKGAKSVSRHSEFSFNDRRTAIRKSLALKKSTILPEHLSEHADTLKRVAGDLRASGDEKGLHQLTQAAINTVRGKKRGDLPAGTNKAFAAFAKGGRIPLIQAAISSNAARDALIADKRRADKDTSTLSGQLKAYLHDAGGVRPKQSNRKTIERIADHAYALEAKRDANGLLKLASDAHRAIAGQQSKTAKRVKGEKRIRQSRVSRDLARLNRTKDHGALLDLVQGSLGGAQRILSENG